MQLRLASTQYPHRSPTCVHGLTLIVDCRCLIGVGSSAFLFFNGCLASPRPRRHTSTARGPDMCHTCLFAKSATSQVSEYLVWERRSSDVMMAVWLPADPSSGYHSQAQAGLSPQLVHDVTRSSRCQVFDTCLPSCQHSGQVS